MQNFNSLLQLNTCKFNQRSSSIMCVALNSANSLQSVSASVSGNSFCTVLSSVIRGLPHGFFQPSAGSPNRILVASMFSPIHAILVHLKWETSGLHGWGKKWLNSPLTNFCMVLYAKEKYQRAAYVYVSLMLSHWLYIVCVRVEKIKVLPLTYKYDITHIKRKGLHF